VGLDGYSARAEPRADLASGETGHKALQHGKLGGSGFLDDVAVSRVSPGHSEILLDGGRESR
jgi:hypothetical protein